MPVQNRQKFFFPNLDGLRFFAFLYVLLTHSFLTEDPLIRGQSWYQIVKVRIFTDGNLGVSFFFVLSGFLISYLLMKEKELTGAIHVRSFYVRRILRIWPLYFLIVFFGFKIFPLLKIYFGGTPHETADPLLCSTFLNNFDRIYNGRPDASVLGGLWTIAIEEQFYIVWPLLFFITPEKYYKYIFMVVFILSTLFRVFFRDQTNIDLHTLGVITDMAIGGMGAYLVMRHQSFVEKLNALPRVVIAVPYVMAALFIFFKNEIFASELMWVFKNIILASTFTFIILEQNYARNSFFKVGNNRFISWLGQISYGLYCFHPVGILISHTLLNKLSLSQYAWQICFLEVPLSLLISIMISAISYKYFESLFLKLKGRFSYIKKE